MLQRQACLWFKYHVITTKLPCSWGVCVNVKCECRACNPTGSLPNAEGCRMRPIIGSSLSGLIGFDAGTQDFLRVLGDSEHNRSCRKMHEGCHVILVHEGQERGIDWVQMTNRGSSIDLPKTHAPQLHGCRSSRWDTFQKCWFRWDGYAHKITIVKRQQWRGLLKSKHTIGPKETAVVGCSITKLEAQAMHQLLSCACFGNQAGFTRCLRLSPRSYRMEFNIK